MKGIGYARVSTQEQVTDGTSLGNQAEQIKAYAAMRGIELVDILVEGGVSGGKPLSLRPEGSKLSEMIVRGEVHAVIITKLDRGFRSASDCLVNIEAWEKQGISLHILNLGGTTIDTGTPTGKFFITVMAGAAELERNLIKERCNEGRRVRKAEGKRLGTVPFGYCLGADGKTLEPCEDEQRVLSNIQYRANRGDSLRAIARDLSDANVPTKQGGSWTHRGIASILRRVA